MIFFRWHGNFIDNPCSFRNDSHFVISIIRKLMHLWNVKNKTRFCKLCLYIVNWMTYHAVSSFVKYVSCYVSAQAIKIQWSELLSRLYCLQQYAHHWKPIAALSVSSENFFRCFYMKEHTDCALLRLHPSYMWTLPDGHEGDLVFISGRLKSASGRLFDAFLTRHFKLFSVKLERNLKQYMNYSVLCFKFTLKLTKISTKYIKTERFQCN